MSDLIVANQEVESRGFRFGVGRRFLVSFVSIFAISCITGLVFYQTGLSLARLGEESAAIANAKALIGQLNLNGARQKFSAYEYIITQRSQAKQVYDQATTDFSQRVAEIKPILEKYDPHLLKLVFAYVEIHAVWQSKIGDAAFAPDTGAGAMAKGRDLLQSTLAAQLNDQSLEVAKAEVAAAQDAADKLTAQFDLQMAFLTKVIVLGVAASAAAAALIGWLLTKNVASPLIGIAAALKRLAQGDGTVSVPGLGRHDEIGDVAASLHLFKAAIAEKQALAAAAGAQREQAEQERAQNEQRRLKSAEELAAVVDALAEGLEKLSSGDLTFRISRSFIEDYEKLRTDFNLAVSRLQDVMKTVLARMQTLRGGSAEISQASEDLSKRTEQQAASLEQTAAALDEITATVRKTADGAVEAQKAVSTAKTDAEKSAAVVREAVGAMSQIDESSRQIGQIISVIDEIAFQTNLLALNAGVEAARAGDAGRGFAVVASEVRALAQRSAEAAKEIKTLISASTQQVSRGVDWVGETGKALERIATQVAQINGAVAEIAASAQEQATGLNEVNMAVNQMDQVTQQNAAMVEQSTAAAQSLREESDALSGLMAQFQVDDAPPVTAAARPGTAKARPLQAAPQNVATFIPGGRGKATRGTAAAPAAWKEF